MKRNMTPKFKTLLLWSMLFALTTCKFSAVDYAVGDVQLASKTKVTIDGNPGVQLTIVNSGDETVTNVLVTIKAKRGQRDLEIQTIALSELRAGAETVATAVFRTLTSHSDYDMLTYAVAFSQ